MFNLGGLNDLSGALGIDRRHLQMVLDDFDQAPHLLVKELTLWHPDASKKPRDVISILKPWRVIQDRVYRKLLLPWFKPHVCSHGGIRRRSPSTNARRHLGNTHAFVADISNFFPSVSCFRVNKFFLGKACSPKVASILTRLCTYDFHLALGLVTSPIIANEILRPIDERIEHACRQRNLVYSRFIDDITISGKYDPSLSGIENVVQDVLVRHHFKVAKDKTDYGRLDVPSVADRDNARNKQLAITGVRLKGDHLDPSRKFTKELERIIDDHISLSHDGTFVGPLLMESEVFGKAHYATSLNPGRRRQIFGRLKMIDWSRLMGIAVTRELVRLTKRMTPRNEARPDCSMQLPLVAGAQFVREYYKCHSYDPTELPFDVTD